MQLHRRIAGPHARGQVDVDRRGLAALFAPALEGEADGIRMRDVTLECLADGGLQVGGAVAVKQPGQPVGDGAKIGAAFGGGPNAEGLPVVHVPLAGALPLSQAVA